MASGWCISVSVRVFVEDAAAVLVDGRHPPRPPVADRADAKLLAGTFAPGEFLRRFQEGVPIPLGSREKRRPTGQRAPCCSRGSSAPSAWAGYKLPIDPVRVDDEGEEVVQVKVGIVGDQRIQRHEPPGRWRRCRKTRRA